MSDQPTPDPAVTLLQEVCRKYERITGSSAVGLGDTLRILASEDMRHEVDAWFAARLASPPEPRAALAEVWDEAVREMHGLGWMHDWALSDGVERNPYRALAAARPDQQPEGEAWPCTGCGRTLRKVRGLMTCDHPACPGNLRLDPALAPADQKPEGEAAWLVSYTGDRAVRPYCLRCEVPIYQDDDGVWRREGTGSDTCPRCAGRSRPHEPLEAAPAPAVPPRVAVAEVGSGNAYTCPTGCVERNHPGREHAEWIAGHRTWLCDVYDEPTTCLSARVPVDATCRPCRARGADRLLAAALAAAPGADRAGTTVEVEDYWVGRNEHDDDMEVCAIRGGIDEATARNFLRGEPGTWRLGRQTKTETTTWGPWREADAEVVEP